METPRNRQKMWLGHVLRYGSLVRTVLEGRLPGNKTREKPKEMLLSWLLETNKEDKDYTQLKELTQKQERWCR